MFVLLSVPFGFPYLLAIEFLWPLSALKLCSPFGLPFAVVGLFTLLKLY